MEQAVQIVWFGLFTQNVIVDNLSEWIVRGTASVMGISEPVITIINDDDYYDPTQRQHAIYLHVIGQTCVRQLSDTLVHRPPESNKSHTERRVTMSALSTDLK